MKIFTKIGLALLVGLLSTSMLWAQTSAKEVGPRSKMAGIPIASEAIFDLQFDWPVYDGSGEAGIETDGTYIYTSMWNGAGEFQKYDLAGNWVETFTVAGSAGCRDIAYDGTYFYGGAASTTVFQMDFGTASMVSTFTAPTQVRAIAYNEDEGAFYANNWGSDITKFDMSGANLGAFAVGPTGDSYYGFAYQGASYCGDGPFLWGYAQVGATQNELVQISLPAGTETGTYFDVGSIAAVGTGIAGGLAISDGLVTGYWTIMGTAQNVDIWGLELCVSGPLPANDIGVQSITSPVTGVDLTSAEPVTILVKNYGTDTQTNFDVSFSLDGGTPVVESVSTTLNSGETYEHTFATTVDLSAYGSYSFEACADLTGDENAANDCASKTVENLAPSYCDASTSIEDEFIANVLCGDIDNSSGWQGGVADYTDISTSIEPGMSEDITVTNGNAWTSDKVTCWVDWGMDYTFDVGTDEEFILTNDGTGAVFTGAIAVPAGTAPGDYRMRVRMSYSTDPVPCGVMSYGEVEDYTINVPGGLEYCEASGGGDEFIDGVVFGDINTMGSGENGYEDFTALSTDVEQGGTYTMTVYNGNSYSSDDWGIWIDFNVDGTFADDEMLICDVSNGGDIIEYDIDIPSDAPMGSTRMRVRLKYSGSDCPFDPCGTTTYGEVEDYTVNVVEGSGSTAVCEDFDALTVGGYVADQIGSPLWTTWSNAPGTAEDATVSDLYSTSPSNSMLVSGTNDMVNLFSETNLESGAYQYDFNIYVPTGFTGYFNLQKDVVPGTEWGFQAMFEDDMTIVVDGGAAAAAVIPYDYDTWYAITLIVDLDADWCQFFIDGTLEHEYQWTLGTFGTAGALTLGGANFYANPGAGGTPPGAHFDDICFDVLPTMETARVQAIHNSADLAAEVVDVWLDDVLLLDNFEFRTASPFVDAPAGVEFTLAVKGPDSTTPDDPLWSQTYTLDADETYILVAEGIVSPSGYTPPTPFDIAVYPMGREEATVATNTDVLVNHGSTDAPTVDVYEIGVGAGEIIDDLSYFDFAGYLELGTLDYVLDVRDETGTTSVAKYQAPLATLGLDGAAITVVASGFLDPSNNSNGPAFGLWVALASGGPLVELPLYEEPQNCEDFDDLTVGGYVAQQIGTPLWTTWSGAPGTAEDATVSDLYSTSPSNSMLVSGTNDMVNLFSETNLESGAYQYDFNIYVPTGFTGYFNLQKDVVPGTEWGFQAMFEDDMTIVVDGGAAAAAVIPYDYDTWYAISLIVDLDADWCQFFIDGNLEHEYQWTLGTFGTAGALTLGGANFYANPGAGGTPPGAHFDDVCFQQLESLAPPLNLEAMVEDNDVMLTWDPPAGDKGSFTATGVTIGAGTAEKSPSAKNDPIPTDDLFDLLFDWPVYDGSGEAGIETDGTYIYTSMWNGAGEFQKYDSDGNWIETFTVAGSTGCRDIAYDGTYFYGGAASTTVFQMDFDAATMVSTFTAPTQVRAIAYNEVDDAFYANNWGSAITKFDMAGANLGSFPVGPTGDSYYGFAFDNYSGGTYLWGYAQVGATQNELVQISLPDGTETGTYFDVGSVAAVGTGIAGGLCIDGMIVPDVWTIIGTSQNVNIWGLELAGGGMSDISYNVYRDGMMIGNTTSLNYTDMDLENGTYEYYVTAVYVEGESGPSNTVEAIVDVQVTDCYDFDDLTVGGYVAEQLGLPWTTWSGAVGDPEDAPVTDAQSNSGDNSFQVNASTVDLVFQFGDDPISEGQWLYSHFMYVPSGFSGYFNVQAEPTPGVDWNIELYFDDGGTGSFAGQSTETFEYDQDMWFLVEVNYDFESGYAVVMFDGEEIMWFENTLTIGGIDYYGSTSGGDPGAYYDDVCFGAGFEYTPTLPPGPTNLTGPASVTAGEDIVLNWDAPATGAELQWDSGINDDAIGLTNGGTFSVASHWEPADLTPYDGMMLEEITFFAGDYPGPTFTMKVWTGASATEVSSEPVASFVQNDWNTVALSTPVMIDASQDLWFGYETTNAAGEFPAGCDAGPAIQTYGDMILNGGAWSSLYVLTGGAIDANWNLIGSASYGDGSKASVSVPMVKAEAPVNNSGSYASLGFGSGKKYVPSASKALLGYNVYRDDVMINGALVTETTYTDNIAVPGIYDYYVTAVWDEGESDPSNTWTVDVQTGINENVLGATQVFPNPAKELVNISSDFTINSVTVYNFAGQVVANEKVNGNEYQVNVTQFQPGIYVFQISTAEGMANYRIVVE
ncbi:MAG: DUF4397 domain-containing protein [Bacteroidetes bacterium]|nr:DUF4397 domain-containing protein [Bacteroidota bacterium]